MVARSDWPGRSVSRRAALRRAGFAGLGLAGVALAGCGEDEETPPATATAVQGGAGTSTPAAAGTANPYSEVKRGGTLRLTLTGDPPTIDPYGNNSFHTKGFAAYHYSRLYKLETGPDIDGNRAAPTGDLAVSAETEDGQTWVMKLRPGVPFHNVPPVDGRTLDAEDITFSWDLFNAETNILRDGLVFVESIDVPDDETIVWKLNAPSAIFLEAMADANLLWILPREADGGFDPALTSIGTGPWILERYDPSVEIIRTRHPDYFIEGIPFLDGVGTAIIPETAQRIAQFQAGNTDVEDIPGNDVLSLRDQMPDVQWQGQVSALTSIFYWDHIMDTSKPWSDDRVRKAASMAIDRDALLDLAYNVNALQEAGLDVSTAWNNIIPAGHARWWLDPQSADHGDSGTYFTYDAEEARKMLEAASPGGLEVTYQYTDNRYGSTFNAVAEANIGYLQEAGFNLNVEVQDYNSKYITQTGNGNFDGLAFGYETPFPEAGTYTQRPFGVDESGDPIEKNRSKIIDEDILELSEKQAQEFDVEARRELLWEFQRINGERMYYAPNQAGAGTGWTAYQPHVRGIRSTRGYGAGVETIAWLWLDT